jgi:DNA primase small subunit
MDATVSFLKERFSDYYKAVQLYLPSRFGKREWGFMFLGESFMQRHRAFQNMEGIKRFLVDRVPAHVYHSAAYYEKPDAPTMVEKNWLGADLIFDLDADHIKGAEKMTYEQTLEKVKEEFIRLMDEYLLSDFGFSEKDLTIVFSGGRGYHIHIRNAQVLQLTSHERREIVDYITGRDLDMDAIFPKEVFDKKDYGTRVNVRYKFSMPNESSGGWKRKMREGILSFIQDLEGYEKEQAIKRLKAFEGVGEKTARGIYKDLFSGEVGKRGVDRMQVEGNLEIFSADKHLGAFLRIIKGEVGIKMENISEEDDLDILDVTSVKERIKGETDEPVTSDIKRLIRLPSSLHGKTSFVVTPLQRRNLEEFEPLRDAISPTFTEEALKIKVKKPVNIKLKEQDFKLKKGNVGVPEFAAIFLLCRGFAEIEGDL